MQKQIQYRTKKQSSLPKGAVIPNPQTQASKAHKYHNSRINRNKTFRLSQLYENFVALDHTTNTKQFEQDKTRLIKLPDIHSPRNCNDILSPHQNNNPNNSDIYSSENQTHHYHSNPQFYSKQVKAQQQLVKQRRVDRQFEKFTLKAKPDEQHKFEKKYRKTSTESNEPQIVASSGEIFQPFIQIRKTTIGDENNRIKSQDSQLRKSSKSKSPSQSTRGFIASPVMANKKLHRFNTRIKSMGSINGLNNASSANFRNIISPLANLQIKKSKQDLKSRGSSIDEINNINYLGTCKKGRKEPPTLIKKNIRLINQVRVQNQELAKQKERILRIKRQKNDI